MQSEGALIAFPNYAKLPRLRRITMMSCDFLKIILKKSSCCYALLIGMQGSAVEKLVADVHMKETKCLRKITQMLQVVHGG